MNNSSKVFFAFIFLIVIAIIIHEKESTKNQILVKQQEQQIVIQNEVIKDKKNISQRQAVARAVSTNDNLVWLREYRCKDCKSR